VRNIINDYLDIGGSAATSVAIKHAQRANIGLQKYGVTTERTDLSYGEWLQHMQDEVMDAVVYCERLLVDTPYDETDKLEKLRKLTSIQITLQQQAIMLQEFIDEESTTENPKTV